MLRLTIEVIFGFSSFDESDGLFADGEFDPIGEGEICVKTQLIEFVQELHHRQGGIVDVGEQYYPTFHIVLVKQLSSYNI